MRLFRLHLKNGISTRAFIMKFGTFASASDFLHPFRRDWNTSSPLVILKTRYKKLLDDDVILMLLQARNKLECLSKEGYQMIRVYVRSKKGYPNLSWPSKLNSIVPSETDEVWTEIIVDRSIVSPWNILSPKDTLKQKIKGRNFRTR